MTMESYDCPEYCTIVNRADMITPDGMPLVWALRWLGEKKQQRVYGPDLTLHLCQEAARQKIHVGFYGGIPSVLEKMKKNLLENFAGLDIVYCYSPPYRELSEQEIEDIVQEINKARPQILFVGLGCPKQERWMAAQYKKCKTVMVGVGAAFDFHGGQVKQAPSWLQRLGLEWLFRLLMEPGRLWHRYAKHNPRFVYLFLLQIFKLRNFSKK